MRLSQFGETLSAGSSIVSLMEDLGSALRENPEMLFLGGGNPARIPAVETALSGALHNALADPEKAWQMLGVYQSPAGDTQLRQELADCLKSRYQWPVSAANIAFANGSQSAFFVLFNLFAGAMSDGSARHIQLPLVPEYLGYSELGLGSNFYRASRPDIELIGDHSFKYHVDFSRFAIDADSAAVCVSRPTNPTGNMITDTELAGLDERARVADIPLIIDGAYGLPFPGIVFTEACAHWNENTILVLSLSKLGLPGVRTSVVIADEPVIRAFAQANTVLSLAAGNVGPAIARELLASEQLLQLGREQVTPFYRERCQQTLAILQAALGHLPMRVHRPEGAIFLWLWFEGLPISSAELYQRLKARGVLIIAGEHFFPGLQEPWQHQYECVRISYAQPGHVVEQAAKILSQEVARAYAQG
ncbi:valine--pyruvate transaminase [Gilvimarinus sp. DA14]|uniref:valine--pyruvate transaminase n=1 Tax=Gilvimarinus sp. DA14 TaxID=2956798 RepID=UPI0020B86A08|nr:valine--pyruvate transaminase [Gilvimarinus sp. DA14]UTF60361.1 valine--pyruvate transaminase [Gilvimarinus sp. DA14]